MPINIEIKTRCNNLQKIREILIANHAINHGVEHQLDTYFRSNIGRLKIRESKNETNLIHYIREDNKGLRESKFQLYKTASDSSLKEILEKAIGFNCIVDKQREIFQIGNVKFQLDRVTNLGDFVEIEASDQNGTLSINQLQEQCNYYIKLLEINMKNLISESYSDLLKQNNLFNQIFIEE